MERSEIVEILKDIEDHLMPYLEMDSYERSLYYYLLRHSRVIGNSEVLVAIMALSKALGFSEWSARGKLRSMHKKGCIRIIERRRDGTRVSVLLAREIEGCIVDEEQQTESIDIELVDFFREPQYREAIFKRENGVCFYCLKEITKENYVLDHVVSQVNDGDNTYRNIVASCHECNSLKQDMNGNDFLRNLYRRGVINSEELEQRLRVIDLLQDGKLKPAI